VRNKQPSRLAQMNIMTNKKLLLIQRRGAGRLLAGALAVACAFPNAGAQVLPAAPADAGLRAQMAAPQLWSGRLDASAKVARILVETDRDGVPADGQSPVRVSVQVLGEDGLALKDEVLLTLEASAGRILLDGAASDALGPQNGDADKVTPGMQLRVKDGKAQFRLLAPAAAQEVLLRVDGGKISTQGVITFVPELRQMLAVGLIEGVISKRHLTEGDLAPARFNDGFEQDITRWSRQFNSGKANASARTAFFVKGTILGSKLLTAAYDSDQQSREKLQRDINPNEFYPVYGDSATTAFDARSAGRLYVRVDDKKSYVLYGDFSTSEGTMSSVPGPNTGLEARKLGQYQRSATGLRGNWDGTRGKLGGFAFHDNAKQVIEEYRANGSSGPFAVRNNGALTNSERVELIVRDKNQTDLVKQVTPLRRLEDYSFEPFSGRILFKQAVPSVTPEGDPQSIRVTYEVEQGGEDFWVMGIDGEVRLNDSISVGMASVDDKNPQSPYRLHSVNATVKLAPATSFVAEFAQSESTSYSANGQVFTTPSGQAGELARSATGQAARLALAHKGETLEARAYWQRADEEFNNTAAGISPGHSDAGVNVSARFSSSTTVYGSALQSRDREVVAQRDAVRVGMLWKADPRLTLDFSLQHMKEEGELRNQVGMASNTGVVSNGLNQSGGFFGFGNTNSAISPVNGSAITSFAPVGATSVPGTRGTLDANTVAIGAQYKASDALSLTAVVEHGVSDSGQKRYELGAQYQLSERSRAYARYENQTGLASRYALNPAEKSNAFVAGVESTYLPGASIFSEYRLRDALDTERADGRDLQLASGARNTWNVAEGLALSTNAEYLHVFDGRQQKGVALASALDYTANPLWKASAKLEWRRLFDSPGELGNQAQDQWLTTLSFVRKLDRDWTVLARNYALLSRNNDDISGKPLANSLQERAQLGFAWRPVDHNQFNGLARYEYKNVRDGARADGDNYAAHIVSTHLDYHPSRPWWSTGRLAAKTSTERNLPLGQQKYSAWMASGRVVYDISENWDIGVLGAYLHSPQNKGSSQYARGVEVGYLVRQNLWLSAGYNVSGFRERDLSSAEYTAKGWFVRLRFKFDENVFNGKDPEVNRTLAR
jgi:hypothetical protein